MYENIRNEAAAAMRELLSQANCERGQLVVVGCSSSEIVGAKIGKGCDPEVAQAVLEGVLPMIKENGLYLAAQCCEHLNRALIVEKACAEKYGYEIVAVVPALKAGGAFASAAYAAFDEPVAVEHVRAAAGLDIGLTLIGMHLKDVAVPLRLETKRVGEAIVTAARTRPKFIGGVRAKYE